jgi:Winged helix DNA-binding domain
VVRADAAGRGSTAVAIADVSGGGGQALYDLPDAPGLLRTCPPRRASCPEYDNLLLSHNDRNRVILDNRSVPLPPGNGATAGTFLVDGMWQGSWQIRTKHCASSRSPSCAARTATRC